MPDGSNMAARLKHLLLRRSEEVFISSWPIHKLFLGHSDDLCPLSHFSEMTLKCSQGLVNSTFVPTGSLLQLWRPRFHQRPGPGWGEFLERP